jgi:hypothetical protein
MLSPQIPERISFSSIHQLARLHCNERPLVAPLCCTSRCLSLFRYKFADPIAVEADDRFDSKYLEDDVLDFSFENPVTRSWRLAVVRDKVITRWVAQAMPHILYLLKGR